MMVETTLFEKIIEKEFILIENPKDPETLAKQIKRVYPAKTFLKNDGGFRYAELSKVNSEITTYPCLVLSVTDGLEEVLEKLDQNTFALVHNGKKEFIGFLSPDAAAKNLWAEHQKLHAYLDTILNTIDESCTTIDSNKNVLFWTKGAENIFSFKKEDIVGKSISEFFSEDRLEILKTLKDGTSLYRNQHHARNDLVVMINSNPVYFKDEIIGAVVSEKDITSQIRLNNELYKTSEKLFNLENEVRKISPSADPFSSIRGNSPALKQTMRIVEKAATTDASVLIYGESGVGKELFAKAIHNFRETEKAPFVAINCGAIPHGLFESEIFGYEKGAFSGADQKGKKGKVELAKDGTLFLDEIAEMPLEMQVKILRLLQEKKFYPVGGAKELEVDFRVIAATNRDLKELVNEGKFREDLYYRLNVVNFKIPPLRERPEDIIELIHYFLYEISTKYRKPIHGISQAIMQSLLQYSWPGNIRELKNIVERLVVLSDNGEIRVDDLPSEIERICRSEQKNKTIRSINPDSGAKFSLSEQLQEFEKEIILRELNEVNGNKQLCAKNLGITRATLYNRLNKLGVQT